MVKHGPGRLAWLDQARGVALVAMVVFHLVYDLELFGYLPRGTAVTPPWSWWSAATAGSFLFLSGLSLRLAHAGGLRWRKALWRIARIAAAAGLVSGATYLADPASFVFFGILHAIAAFSLMGLGLMRLPVVVLLALAAALAGAGPHVQHPVFDHPAFLWTGLGLQTPLTVDWEPLFPWGAPFVMGMASARMLPAAMLRPRTPQGGPAVWLATMGRHSLSIYLLHQPVLIAALWAISRLLA